MGRPTCATSRQAQPSIAGTGSRVAVAVHGPSIAAWKRHCWLAANFSKSVFVNPIPRAWEPCASGSKHWSWDVSVGHARAVWPRLPRRSPLHCRPRPRLPAAPTRTLRPQAPNHVRVRHTVWPDARLSGGRIELGASFPWLDALDVYASDRVRRARRTDR